MRAREIMTRPVVTVHTDTPVQQAVALLTEYGITSMPVLDADGRIVGMISESDLLRHRMSHDPRSHLGPAVKDEPDPPRIVEQVMSTTVACLTEHADSADLAETMLEYNVRAIPIVDGPHLLGIVSRRDLLRSLIRNDQAIIADVVGRLDSYSGQHGRWQVDCADGIVTISGYFDDDPQREVVTVLARTVPGVVRVHTQSH